MPATTKLSSSETNEALFKTWHEQNVKVIFIYFTNIYLELKCARQCITPQEIIEIRHFKQLTIQKEMLNLGTQGKE